MVDDHMNLRFDVLRYTGVCTFCFMHFPMTCYLLYFGLNGCSLNLSDSSGGRTGDIYMAFAREKLPPGFASDNEFMLGVTSQTNWSTVICRPHEPERVYYGLYGGELQAEYDVSEGIVRIGCPLH